MSTVVVTYGSHTIKAGLPSNFPSDEEPRLVVPSAVRDVPGPQVGADSAQAAVQQHPKTVPVVQDGKISNWPGFEAVLHSLLYDKGAHCMLCCLEGVLYGGLELSAAASEELSLWLARGHFAADDLGWVKGEEGNLLLAEPLFTAKADREKLTQLAFEVFNVSGFFISDEAVLCLYAVAKQTGTMVDLGHSKTDIASVVEGGLNVQMSRRLPLSGAHLSAHLQRLVEPQGMNLATPYLADALKAACMRVVESRAEARAFLDSDCRPQKYTLPDGQVFSITTEGVQLGEALLQPCLMGVEDAELPEALVSQVQQHPDAGMRKVLLENMTVCGGGSALAGLKQRLLREVRALAPASWNPNIFAKPPYLPDHTLQHAAWVGGAILSKMVFAHGQDITRGDYDESGPGVIHKRAA